MRSLALFCIIVLALAAAPQKKSAPLRKETRTYRGLLVSMSDEEIAIELSDKRALLLQRDSSTKFSKPGIKPGDTVSVDITDDEKGYLHALLVTLEKEGEMPQAPMQGGGARRSATDNEPAVAPDVAPRATTVNPSGENIDPDGGGPPKIRRGIPTPRPASRLPEDNERPAAAPVSRFPAGEVSAEKVNVPVSTTGGERPFIEKAREVAYSFVDTLPNYTVKQVTTRCPTTL